MALPYDSDVDKPVESMTETELLREAVRSLRYLRETLAVWEPLLSVIRGGNGDRVNYVRAAGMRRALRKAGNGRDLMGT